MIERRCICKIRAVFQLLILVLVKSNVLQAQNYKIKELEIELNGDSEITRNRLFVDSNNFLWYSTKNMLVKHLGNKSIFYPVEDENAFDGANFIFEDSKKRVWLTTDNGVFYLNSTETVLKRLKIFEKIEGVFPVIASITEDNNGNVWLSTVTNYIVKIDTSLQVHNVKIFHPSFKLKSKYWTTTAIGIEGFTTNGDVIFTQGGNIYTFDTKKVELIFQNPPREKRIEGNLSYVFGNLNGGDYTLITKNGDIFPKNKSGVYKYNNILYNYNYIPSLDKQVIETPYHEMLLIPSNVRRKVIDNSSLIKYDTKSKSLICFKVEKTKDNWELIKTSSIAFNNRVEQFKIDKKGILYASSLGIIYKIKSETTIFKKHLNDFSRLKGKPNISARGFLPLDNGDILLVTYAGVYKIDAQTKKEILLYPELNYINNLIKINASEILCVGDGTEVVKININTWKTVAYTYSEHPLVKNLQYKNGIKIAKNRLLLASNLGIIEFNTKTETFKKYSIADTLANDKLVVNDILLVNDDMYVLVRGIGVIKKNIKTNKVVTYELGKENGITITNDANGNIWIGTNKGVKVINTDGDMSTPKVLKEVLHNKNVAGIICSKNDVWLSTYKGLYRFHEETNTVHSYYKEDGLTTNEFNRYSYFKGADGTNYFGSLNGYITFKDFPLVKKKKPQIFPVQMSYYDLTKKQQININKFEGQQIYMNYRNSAIDFTFVINDFFSPENNNYFYKIEGLTNDWVALENTNQLKLLSLPPGTHVLQVKGVNTDGLQTQNQIELPIHVSQIFYKQTWFIISILLLFLTSVLLYNQYKIRANKRKIQKKLLFVEFQNRTLIVQLNPHFIFNALGTIKHKLVNKEYKKTEESIMHFSTLMRKTLDLSRNDWVIIEDELAYLKSYVHFKITEYKQIHFTVENELNINFEIYKIPTMLLQPLVENAVIHAFKKNNTENNTITIRFAEICTSKKTLIIDVLDNGVGLNNQSMNKSTSYGIQILKERIQLIEKLSDRKKIELKYITNNATAGTQIRLCVPYIG